MDNKAIVIFTNRQTGETSDLELPLDITANDLIIALNAAYSLGIDVSDTRKCFLKSENPIALIKGNRLLSEYGIINGTEIFFG